ncbi:unnamed protein product, partial [Effrenium voratum]
GALMHAIASPLVGMVYNYSGRDPAITVDFVYGRGQSRRRHLEEASGMQAVAIFTDGMPALCGRRAACAARYVVEHQLFGWIVEQNSEHGVAPSRDQLVEKALCFTPSTLPSEVRRALAASFNAQPRAQRKWLARFRARWGARLGVLKVQEVVPLEERQAKARRRLAQVEASVFEETLELGWAKAFLRDGLMMQQERMSEGLMLALGSAGVPELRREPPSLAEAKAMPPRGLKLNIMSYVCWAQPRAGGTDVQKGQESLWNVGMPALCGRRAACAARYVVEHQLFGWIVEQNSEHGVAPSRDQLVEKALCFTPSTLPSEVRRALAASFNAQPRAQRKWLARFRARWGARLGVLKVQEVVPLEERQAKARRRLAQVEASVFEETLELGWAKAFLRDGLMMQQERMSEGLMLALGSAGVPELRREPPSLAEAKAMPPRGLKLNIMSYVCWAQPRSPSARKALPTEASVMAGQAALLWEELARLKKQKEEAKKSAREAAKKEKNAVKRRGRLLKAARGLCKEDLQLLLAAKNKSEQAGQTAAQ